MMKFKGEYLTPEFVHFKCETPTWAPFAESYDCIPPYDAIKQMVNQIDNEYLKLLSDNNLNPEWYEPVIETDWETGKITITAMQKIKFLPHNLSH